MLDQKPRAEVGKRSTASVHALSLHRLAAYINLVVHAGFIRCSYNHVCSGSSRVARRNEVDVAKRQQDVLQNNNKLVREDAVGTQIGRVLLVSATPCGEWEVRRFAVSTHENDP